ncbi:Cell wall-associated hydrolase, NlpC family [Kytococcus aerolatus]|uniref:Cell wall-associated hydrolase, NlpC family n=1 Tax=Kytococcus aerolatus TaxID=592308 RepID=A0A212T2V6_9MICO|nr:C40 family peptidase [Kytococcus aerolatus]SNC60372.1 Cell wall-associated hydrolase, NlpC family [Kytococcus aerolatus]
MSMIDVNTPALDRRALLTGAAATAGAGALALGTASEANAITQYTRRAIYRKARAKEGLPYVYGAEGPYAFDCSGLTQWAHKQYGLALPRTAAQQYRATRSIYRSSATLGDLLFIGNWSHASHVGFYVPWNGRHYIYHAPRPGRRLSCDRIWTWRYKTRRAF